MVGRERRWQTAGTGGKISHHRRPASAGRSEDFATEMFVIINSPPTRINKSHLIDLYEKVSWAEPDRRFAAHITEMLYREADSPLRYRINRLGGRSKQEKWI